MNGVVIESYMQSNMHHISVGTNVYHVYVTSPCYRTKQIYARCIELEIVAHGDTELSATENLKDMIYNTLGVTIGPPKNA